MLLFLFLHVYFLNLEILFQSRKRWFPEQTESNHYHFWQSLSHLKSLVHISFTEEKDETRIVYILNHLYVFPSYKIPKFGPFVLVWKDWFKFQRHNAFQLQK